MEETNIKTSECNSLLRDLRKTTKKNIFFDLKKDKTQIKIDLDYVYKNCTKEEKDSWCVNLAGKRLSRHVSNTQGDGKKRNSKSNKSANAEKQKRERIQKNK
ncbi:hypothetical protein TNIN_133331 [Trichonephila inaurata madagascariensis]|uniref:Uncharacterized protein n=1 Tax=Trichonephila inaurata madagascariensis TaxID=2747483 RepID=A0A8X7CRM5_9ARAC|nr:hypothetical protein TNIN_133331 [Trichonephila inaurata madagascariensis]